MPCWVVPSIAAEFWRVSVDHVLHGIKQGTIQSKSEDGFLFVDVAPGSPILQKPEDQPSILPDLESHQTFISLTTEELQALEGEIDESTIPPDPFDDPRQPPGHFSQWMLKRRQASRSRRAPVRARAA